MKAPIKHFSTLYHVGALKAAPAPFSRSSHEGPCLSVSEVPSAWTQIARLGGNPVWQLRKDDNAFLNVYEISEQLLAEINEWGVRNGFVVLGDCCKTEVDNDDEDGNTRCYTYATLEQAIHEHGEPEPGIRHQIVPLYYGTKKLEDYAGMSFERAVDFASDMLLLAYADQVLDVDGLFWDENLDVYALSAPRAGIIQRKVESWVISPAGEMNNSNEEEI